MQYTITTSFNIISNKVELDAYKLSYTNLGKYHSLECNNVDNHKAIMSKCNKITNLIKEIEELNK